MIYFIIFITSFLLGIWIKVNGEVIKIESSNYTIIINLCFVIIACVVIIFLFLTILRLFYYTFSIFAKINYKKKEREEILAFESLLSMDINYSQDNLDNQQYIVKIFNAGKLGNYSFFTNSLMHLTKLSRNLPLIISYKLINYLKKNDQKAFKSFIEHCATVISDRTLSLPFHIEYAILQNNWPIAISKLKEATKLNILLPCDYKKMFAVFYCALAKEYWKNNDLKGAIKCIDKAKSYDTTFRPINYLKAALYIKLNKIKKASMILETEYTVNPTPQIAKLYFELNSYNAERLYNLRQDYYFSDCIVALSAINLGKYDIAEQYLNAAVKKAHYLSIYLVIIQLKTLSKEDCQAIYWLNQLHSHALPDPGWKCKNCNYSMSQWDSKCEHCSAFNTIIFTE